MAADADISLSQEDPWDVICCDNQLSSPRPLHGERVQRANYISTCEPQLSTHHALTYGSNARQNPD